MTRQIASWAAALRRGGPGHVPARRAGDGWVLRVHFGTIRRVMKGSARVETGRHPVGRGNHVAGRGDEKAPWSRAVLL